MKVNFNAESGPGEAALAFTLLTLGGAAILLGAHVLLPVSPTVAVLLGTLVIWGIYYALFRW